VTDTAALTGRDYPAAEGQLDESVWLTLVDSVNAGKCTPFLGAGVAWPHLPTGKGLSTTLASEFDYPLKDPTNLARVVQYIATLHDPPFAKRRVRRQIKSAQDEFFESTDQNFPVNYKRLADLNLPIYLTTNYDDFLTRALQAAKHTPWVEVCRWNDQLQEELGGYPTGQPSPERPLVFHLHGELSNDSSLLVTEDDYIDFTVSLGLQGEDSVIPHWIRRALSRTTLLFVGYSLEDWNFRVLMRQLMKQQRVQRYEQALSLSIQLSDTDIPLDRRPAAERFLADYLGTSAIRIYWGEAGPFLTELDRRCREARTASE
jgi:SIR2-like protein